MMWKFGAFLLRSHSENRRSTKFVTFEYFLGDFFGYDNYSIDPNECKAGEVDLADKSVFLGVTLIIKLSKPNVPRGRAHLNLCTRIEQDPNECKAWGSFIIRHINQ